MSSISNLINIAKFNVVDRINERRKFKHFLKTKIQTLGIQTLSVIQQKHNTETLHTNHMEEISKTIKEIQEKRIQYKISKNYMYSALDEILDELNIKSYIFLANLMEQFDSSNNTFVEKQKSSISLSKEILEDFDNIFSLIIDKLYSNNNYFDFCSKYYL